MDLDKISMGKQLIFRIIFSIFNSFTLFFDKKYKI